MSWLRSVQKTITNKSQHADPKIKTKKLQPKITPKNHIHENWMETTTICEEYVQEYNLKAQKEDDKDVPRGW